MMFRVDDVLNGLGGLRRFTCTHRDSGTPLDSAPLELELDLHTSGSLDTQVVVKFQTLGPSRTVSSLASRTC